MLPLLFFYVPSGAFQPPIWLKYPLLDSFGHNGHNSQ